MSHGVTENTANLNCSGDARGLNEATSDIFGAAVEFYASNSAHVGDHLIGEKIDINGNGTPLRYMDRPSRDGSSQDCWTTNTKNLDPHYFSGPLNHWFYLARRDPHERGLLAADVVRGRRHCPHGRLNPAMKRPVAPRGPPASGASHGHVDPRQELSGNAQGWAINVQVRLSRPSAAVMVNASRRARPGRDISARSPLT